MNAVRAMHGLLLLAAAFGLMLQTVGAQVSSESADSGIEALYELGKYEQSRLRALGLIESQHPAQQSNPQDLALRMHQLGRAERALGLYRQAERHLGSALMHRSELGDGAKLATADTLVELGVLHREQGNLSESQRLFQRALKVFESVLGPDDPRTATTIYELGRLQFSLGEIDDARANLERAMAIHRDSLGPRHPQTAADMSALGELLQQMADTDSARNLLAEALAVQEDILPADHLDIALTLGRFATLLQDSGDLAGARPVYERALAICLQAVGEDHPATALGLDGYAGVLVRMGDISTAKPFMERALATRRRILGSEHASTAVSLNNMGSLLHRIGDLGGARPLLIESVDIHHTLFGADHPSTATSLGSLGALLAEMGDFAGALDAFERGLRGRESVLGPEHPRLMIVLNNLGFVFIELGDTVSARVHLDRALAVGRKTVGESHPFVGITLANTSRMLLAEGNIDSAIEHAEQALANFEKSLGSTHFRTARAQNDLGEAHFAAGNMVRAEIVFAQARQQLTEAVGGRHPLTAKSLYSLARSMAGNDKLHDAKDHMKQALEIQESILGPVHPAVADSLNELAKMEQRAANLPEVVALSARALNVEEALISATAYAGSPRQKIAYLAQFVDNSNRILSLSAALGPDNSDVTRIAAETVLRRKGRALDLSYEQSRLIRQQALPEQLDLLDELIGLRERHAYMSLYMPRNVDADARLVQLKLLQDDIDKLETSLSQLSRRTLSSRQPVSLQHVQQALDHDQILIEFATYRPYDGTAAPGIGMWPDPHYLAFAISKTNVASVDLGPVGSIDEAIDAFRESIVSQDTRANDMARNAHALIIQKVRALVGKQSKLVLSPDGNLNVLPFAALMDDAGRFLIQDYEIAYVTSGRDLLRWQDEVPLREPPMVVGNVSFGGSPGPIAESRGISTSIDLESLYFAPLPATEQEALRIASILGLPTASGFRRFLESVGADGLANSLGLAEGRRTLTDEDATEAAVKSASGPAVLHLATHGFYLSQLHEVPAASHANASDQYLPEHSQDPLLRSGIALAGFNRRSEATNANDGVFTALEVAALDLWGTRIVTVSACDSGLGDIRTGEGVFGLRRSLVLAGAETQVLTLWKVADAPTQDMMVDWYQRLRDGAGRAAGMRSVQLDALASDSLRHPYFWSGFVVSGNPGPVDAEIFSMDVAVD